MEPVTYPRSKPLSLDDLPTEILEQIAGHLCGCPSSTVYISRRPDTTFTPSSLLNNQIRHHFSATGYPLALLQVNRRISAIVFAQLWRETAFVLNLSSSDALCFLKYALSDRQRAALRRIRCPRFIIDWNHPVGGDLWLAAEHRRAAHYAVRLPHLPRVANLVDHLQQRHPAVQMAIA